MSIQGKLETSLGEQMPMDQLEKPQTSIEMLDVAFEGKSEGFLRQIDSFKKALKTGFNVEQKSIESKSRLHHIQQRLERINFNFLHQKHQHTKFSNASVERVSGSGSKSKENSLHSQMRNELAIAFSTIGVLVEYKLLRATFNHFKIIDNLSVVANFFERYANYKQIRETLEILREIKNFLKTSPIKSKSVPLSSPLNLSVNSSCQSQNSHANQGGIVGEVKTFESESSVNFHNIYFILTVKAKCKKYFALRSLRIHSRNAKGLSKVVKFFDTKIDLQLNNAFKIMQLYSMINQKDTMKMTSVIESFVTVFKPDFTEFPPPANCRPIIESIDLMSINMQNPEIQMQQICSSGFKKRKESAVEPIQSNLNLILGDIKDLKQTCIVSKDSARISIASKNSQNQEFIKRIDYACQVNSGDNSGSNRRSDNEMTIEESIAPSNTMPKHVTKENSVSSIPFLPQNLKQSIEVQPTKKVDSSKKDSSTQANQLKISQNVPERGTNLQIDPILLEFSFNPNRNLSNISESNHNWGSQRKNNKGGSVSDNKDELFEHSQLFLEFWRNESFSRTDLGSYLKDSVPEAEFLKYCEFLFNPQKNGLNLSLENVLESTSRKFKNKRESTQQDFSEKKELDNLNLNRLSHIERVRNSMYNTSSCEKDRDFIRDSLSGDVDAKLCVSKDLIEERASWQPKAFSKMQQSLNITEGEEKLAKEMEKIIKQFEKEQSSFDLVESPKGGSHVKSLSPFNIYADHNSAEKQLYNLYGLNNSQDANFVHLPTPISNNMGFFDPLQLPSNNLNMEFVENFSQIVQSNIPSLEKIDDDYCMNFRQWNPINEKQRLNLPEIKEESAIYEKSQMMSSKNTSHYFLDIKNSRINSSKILYEQVDKTNQINAPSGGEILSLPNLESFRGKEVMEPLKVETHPVINSRPFPPQPSPRVTQNIKDHVEGKPILNDGENQTKSIMKRLTPILQKERHTPLLAKSPNRCASVGHARKKSSLIQNDENDNQSNRVQTPLNTNVNKLLRTFDVKHSEKHSKSYSSKSKSIELSKKPALVYSSNPRQTFQHTKTHISQLAHENNFVSNYRSLDQILLIPNETNTNTKPKSTQSIKLRPVEKSSFKSTEAYQKPSINQERPKSHKIYIPPSTREPCFQRAISKSIAKFEPRPTNFVASLIYKNPGIAERRDVSQKNGSATDPFWQVFRGLKNARSETRALSRPRHRDQFKVGQSSLKSKPKY